MKNYNLSSLNDKEFEVLCADLLGEHYGTHIERFKPGRDGGVDGRFFLSEDNEVVIQCKHWIKSSLSALKRHIKKEEVAKVNKLKPARYIFVTSLELSRLNKTEIKKLFSPHIISETDVIGCEDLNDFLAEHKEIERRHYKLWITSTNVLQSILNAGIIGRSQHKSEIIAEKSKKYVVTISHDLAIKKLEQLRSIVITGEPGIGKTTLADQLCQFYAAKGFQLCFIENSLNEAEEIYSPDKDVKQIFYFDDFLGRNFLEALHLHQDSQIFNFMKRIEKDQNKLFILTSRSNILNSGKHLSDLYNIEKIERNEYELSITSLTEYDKAKILYNHIFFSNLSESFIDEIYDKKRYLKIIKHKNFNPRLIEFITDSDRLTSLSPDKYWEYIQKTLTNPKDIWSHLIEVQIDEISRHIVIAVALNGYGITEKDIKKFHERMMVFKPQSRNNKTFNSTMKILVGALLNRYEFNGKVSYELFNPSIADYVIAEYLSDEEYMCCVLSSLQTASSITYIWNAFKSDLIDKNYISNLLHQQLLQFTLGQNCELINEYKLRLLNYFSSDLTACDAVIEYVRVLSESISKQLKYKFDADYFHFVIWVLDLEILNPNDSRFIDLIDTWVNYEDYSFEEYVPLTIIIDKVETPSSKNTLKLKELLVELISESITQDVIDNQILEDLHYHDEDYVLKVDDLIINLLSEYAFSFDDDDINKISESFNVDYVINYNQESYYHNDDSWDHRTPNSSVTSNDIEDLFDRS